MIKFAAELVNNKGEITGLGQWMDKKPSLRLPESKKEKHMCFQQIASYTE